MISGLGLLDVTTTRGPVRAVGRSSALERPRRSRAVVDRIREPWRLYPAGTGCEAACHGEIGIGNCNDGTEGAVAGTVIGTYPHGPVLARNPALADHVLALALGHDLPPLVRPEIDKLRRQRLARVRRLSARGRGLSRVPARQLGSGSR